MNCETCKTDIKSVNEAHSIVAVLQKLTPKEYTFFQCEEGQVVDYHSYQHWHCCMEHAHDYMIVCLNEHYAEEKLHPIPVGQGFTNLPKIVLGYNKLSCKICGSPLKEQAYRIALTRATPYNELLNENHDTLSGWCCSLEHAKEDAIRSLQYESRNSD